MKTLKKCLALFLAILTLFSICSASTTVLAAEYTEQQERTEYFDSALSGYLKNIVDTKDAVSISEKDQVDEAVEEVNSSVARTASTFSLRAASVQSTENAKEAAEELDIDHTRLTLELEDGENVAYLFSEPVSFIDDEGNLVYKDTNIKAVTDSIILNRGYSFENGNNDYKAYFSEDSAKGLLLVEKDSREIRLVPNGVKVLGTVGQVESDMKLVDSFEYVGVYGEGTVLRFMPQLNGCKEEIVLSSYQGVSDFSFTLYTEEGTIAAIDSKGEVEIINSETKEIITTFVSPFANDSSGGLDVTSEHYTDCTYELEMISEGKYTLTICVPKEYLESENTVYPVVIDPTTSNISMELDTAVYSERSDSPQGGNPTACFGKTGESEYGKGRALFYFPLPSDIKRYAKISSAKLWLRETTGREYTMYVRPYFVTESWNNSTTWNTQPAYSTTFSYLGTSGVYMARRNINSTSTDEPDVPYWYAFNITNAVRAWATGTSNKGVMFIAECEAASGEYLWRAFATKEHTTSAFRPYAVISYTNDTTAPTISSVSGNPTAWTKNNVTLTVTATDDVYGVSGIAGYSFDNGSTWQTSKSKAFSANKTVYIKVKDKRGNISAAKTVKITKIDKTAPTISKVELNPTDWTNGNVTVTVTASDAGSGLADLAYSFNNGSDWQTGNSKSFDLNTSSINIKVRDKLGNIATYSGNPVQISNIDKTAPVASAESKVTSTSTKITVTASDDLSGLHSTAYSFDEGAWQASNVYLTEPCETITIKVRDKANNIKEFEYTPPTIDGITVTPSIPNDVWTNKNIVLTVNGSGIVKYKFGDNDWQTENSFEFDKNGEVVILVEDENGFDSNAPTYNITNIDKTDPVVPSVYEQDGTLYISAPSLGEKGGSPETLKYQLGDNNEDNYIAVEGNSIELDVVRTYNVPVYAYVEDGAGNKAAATFTLENNLGEYTASYTDIAFGEGLFPVEFGRTYTSTNGWFFTFDANVAKIDDNAYVFTDFYGEKHYFIKNSEGKYLSVDDEELTVTTDESKKVTSFELTCGDMTCTFGANGKINRIVTDYLDTQYTWSDNSLTVTGGATVTFTNGKPTEINITREGQVKEVDYVWNDGNLTKFIDAADVEHNYAYTNGLLTTNDTEAITYSDEGRVKLISQPNGAFVKYTYDDSATNSEAPNNVGAVMVSDSKGVTDTIYYADGVYISNILGSYSDNVIYAPESISNTLTQDSVADIFYVVEVPEEDESADGAIEGIDETGTEDISSDEMSTEEEITDAEPEANVNEITEIEYPLHTENIEYNSYGSIVLKEETIYESGTDNEPDVYKEEYLYDVWNQCVEKISTSNSKVSVEKTEYDILGRIIKLTRNDKVTNYLYDNKGSLVRETTNNEVTQYEYSNSGNVLLKTLPDNTTISYCYDLFGNIISKTYLGYKYTYNTLGNMLDVSIVTSENPNGVIVISYDYSEDLIQTLISTNYSNEQKVNYLYNESGKMNSIKTDDEEQFVYSYFEEIDENGESIAVTEISDNINNWKKVIADGTSTVFDSYGNILYAVEKNMLTDKNGVSKYYHKETISNDVYKVNSNENSDVFSLNNETLFRKYYQYDKDESITASIVDDVISTYYSYNGELVYTYNNQFNNAEQTYTYTYDDNENIVNQILIEKKRGELGETIELSEFTNYVYDNKNQLLSAETSSSKWTYIYDDRGNILCENEYEVSLDENNEKVYTLIENGTDIYVYDEIWKDKLISYNGQIIIYDAVGNPTNYMGNTLTWTMGRQLATFGDISYTYNEDGIRTSKRSGDVITKYYLDEANIIEQDDDVNRLHFLYDSRNEIIGFVYNENVYHYVKNIQNDITAILNSAGDVVAEYEYDAWGKVLSVTGSYVELGNLNPFRYRSYYYDSDIQMYYLQSRYYDPEVRRFISSDDYSYIESQEEGLSWNAFSYCTNNPVNLEDPTGYGIKELLKLLKKFLPAVKLIDSLADLITIKYDNLDLEENGKITDYDRTNSTKGVISVDFTKQTDNWYNAFKQGNKFANDIADIALEKFRKSNAKSAKNGGRIAQSFNRDFLFTRYCVSREIRLHLQGYLWAKGYEDVDSVKIFRTYYYLNKDKTDEDYKDLYEKERKNNSSITIEKLYVARACETADIYEADAALRKYDEALYFGYYLSIANCYVCSEKDPYCYDIANMKRSVIFTRLGWLNLEL